MNKKEKFIFNPERHKNEMFKTNVAERITPMNNINKVLKEFDKMIEGLDTTLIGDDGVLEYAPFHMLEEDIKQFITKALQDRDKEVIEMVIELRDLCPDEKGKSLDYWEGYTMAITNLLKQLKER